ncbi:DNA-binding HxlR family transcriptional regulator [Kitasatospora sp. MAP12-15]|uniref:replication-relaxation family protein n=1 Tax=unclassified Kitasatospora TaxID=2633591 RepID=UPI002474ECE9|nr:replication-relaxation family protein [Kitasatospora sp. MAP12-44]MDH6107850.1 DNA-binding HxlR family transcriptional regulator [Kitasatospora sp. MAP12-44]
MATPPEIDHAVVAALYQFRMATAEQLRTLHTPGSRPELMRRRLRRLKDEGLVEDVTLPQAGKLRAWFLTERGARIAARFPELEGVASPPLPEDKTEARLRVGHILAVTRTQAAFVAGARKAGDECAPLDFLPEVYHRFGEGRDGAVIADGLLHYATGGPGRTLSRAFVEVDRGTMASEKLAARLIGYARFREHHPVPPHLRRTAGAQSILPAWQQHYVVFPRLLFVLADTGERAARQRIRDLQSIADAHPLVARMLMTVKAGAARLDDLEQHGTSAAVWHTLTDHQRPLCGAWEL